MNLSYDLHKMHAMDNIRSFSSVVWRSKDIFGR